MALRQQELDALWDFSDPAESEARLRAAADAETDAATRAELETQVARALGLQERFAEGDAVLDAIPADLAARSSSVRARVLLERGRLRDSAGDADAAAALFREAADAASASRDLVFLHVDALHMLAADTSHTAEWTAQALDALEDGDDPRTLRWRVSLHNNAGWDHFDAGRLDEALAEFERAKDAAVRWGTPQQVQWADEAIAEATAAITDRRG